MPYSLSAQSEHSTRPFGESLTVVNQLFISFAFTMPIFLVRALAHDSQTVADMAQRCFCAGDRWRPGPWNLGRWGKPVGIYACGYVLLMLPILCFPAARGANLSAKTMNWYDVHPCIQPPRP